MESWLNLNGNMLAEDECFLSPENRAFRYGDALFESIRVAYGHPQLLSAHLERILAGMKFLKMEVPAAFTVHGLRSMIASLCEKNNTGNDARVRITVFRNEGGLYTPSTNSVSFLIEARAVESEGYELNSKGHAIDVYTEVKKPLNALAPHKTANALLYVLAGIHKTQNQLDDCVIINEKFNICEAISSNIFVVKNGALYTPSLDEGCIAGVMRQQVLKVARESRVAVYEISLLMNVLLNADELFLTNAVNGIVWVGAYKGKRYFNNTARIFCEKLNVAAKASSGIKVS
jgi:branched-subunit amino acid aminotransferase/4-amino-4-deoxychorismate lyase